MKTITETISKISNDDIKDLTHSLKIKSKSEKNISSALQNINGLNNLLSTLNADEIMFLRIVYSFKDGITFGQIEKELKSALLEELRKSEDPRIVGSDKEIFDSYIRYSPMREFPKPEK